MQIWDLRKFAQNPINKNMIVNVMGGEEGGAAFSHSSNVRVTFTVAFQTLLLHCLFIFFCVKLYAYFN